MHAYAVLAGCNKQGTKTADVTETETPTVKVTPVSHTKIQGPHTTWNVTGPHWLTSRRTDRRKGKEHPSTFSPFTEGDLALQQLCPIHKHLHLENTAEPKLQVCLSYLLGLLHTTVQRFALTRRYHGCCWGCVNVYCLWATYVQMCQGPGVLDAVKDIILP